MTVEFKIKFQKKVGAAWQTEITTSAMITPVAGTANYDSGWINFTPAVAEEWRVLANADLIDGAGNKTALAGNGSVPTVPRP